MLKKDSRKIVCGDTYVDTSGNNEYVFDAVKNGAVEVISKQKYDDKTIVVEDPKEYYNNYIYNKYYDSIKDLKLIGVTGTNGKTTISYIIYQLLNKMNVRCAYIGTIGFYKCGIVKELNNTTPDIDELYEYLYECSCDNIEYVVMEVSSHSLVQDRVYGLKYDVAIFTNLTEDHLDYHKTMENYLNAKLKIFDYMNESGKLIVNNDDNASKAFVNKFGSGIKLGYNNTENDYNILKTEINPAETKIKFTYKNETYNVTTNLTSKFNVYNYMTSLAILHECGYKIEDIIDKTKEIKAPKGRCETHKVNGGYAVIDYAHTPDAVEKVITAYNELKKGKVITIVGCGGDRDPIKRPIMGGIATKLSDYTILTSDNPRTEDPAKIMEDILKGVKSTNYEVELDRKTAIKKGIEMLKPEDILLILGKGHEDYQIIGHTKIHLDDAEEVENWKKEHN